MNRKGISQLVEVAGVLAIIVACIILVVPQAKMLYQALENSYY